MTDNKRPSVFM